MVYTFQKVTSSNMKIYILRHEQRTEDCSFFSPLIEKGLFNAKKLVPYLKACNIDIIYSSPFIRTLQTIYPFVKQNKKTINIEYGLSEIHLVDIIPKKGLGITLPEYLGKYYNYNCNYESIIKSTDIKYPEKYDDVVKRIKIILIHLIKKYGHTNYNILLVTHQSLCTAILQIIKNSNHEYSTKFKTDIDNHLLYNYPKGKITLIYDNDWYFELIN